MANSTSAGDMIVYDDSSEMPIDTVEAICATIHSHEELKRSMFIDVKDVAERVAEKLAAVCAEVIEEKKEDLAKYRHSSFDITTKVEEVLKALGAFQVGPKKMAHASEFLTGSAKYKYGVVPAYERVNSQLFSLGYKVQYQVGEKFKVFLMTKDYSHKARIHRSFSRQDE